MFFKDLHTVIVYLRMKTKSYIDLFGMFFIAALTYYKISKLYCQVKD